MKEILFIISIFFFSCQSNQTRTISEIRNDFTKEEKELINVSREMIKNCYYGTFITIDENGQPRARIMEPFFPDENFEIWMATNPKSRKVQQIRQNPKTTMHYYDKNNMAYVSFMGNAYIVNDEQTKAQKWKKGWEQHYDNQKEAYMLIRFVPNVLELINFSKGYNGDKDNWAPHKVKLRN